MSFFVERVNEKGTVCCFRRLNLSLEHAHSRVFCPLDSRCLVRTQGDRSVTSYNNEQGPSSDAPFLPLEECQIIQLRQNCITPLTPWPKTTSTKLPDRHNLYVLTLRRTYEERDDINCYTLNVHINVNHSSLITGHITC